jgi:hypothetical protein
VVDGEDDGQDLAGSPRGWRDRLGVFALFALLHRLEKRQREAAAPEIVAFDDRSQALADRALRLAEEAGSDVEAVDDLRRSAGRHRRALRRAATLVRFAGACEEDRVDNRANKLLLAAADGKPIEPVGQDQEAWFARIEAFRVLPLDEAFSLLVDAQPALMALESTLRERGEAERGPDGTVDDEVQDQISTDIWRGLPALVGPKAESTDRLVRSSAAFGVARIHIERAARLVDDLEE